MHFARFVFYGDWGWGGGSYFGYLVPDIRPPPQSVPRDCDFSVGSDKILRASMSNKFICRIKVTCCRWSEGVWHPNIPISKNHHPVIESHSWWIDFPVSRLKIFSNLNIPISLPPWQTTWIPRDLREFWKENSRNSREFREFRLVGYLLIDIPISIHF